MKKLDELEKELIDEPEKSDGKNDLLRFFIGLILLGVGIFSMLQVVTVQSSWYTWRIGSFAVPTGAITIPLLIGIAMLFFNSKSIAGWIVTVISVAFIVVTIIMSVRIEFQRTSMFVFILIFGAIFAGAGLLLSAIFTSNKKKK